MTKRTMAKTKTKTKTRSKPAKKATAAAKAAAKAPPPRSHAFSVRGNQAAEKLRNLSSPELENKWRELQDQLFRLKFQLRMGQTESLKKIRGLRRDLARVKTIARGRALGTEPMEAEKK
ncbi:MAG: 50S ribosomal protein L29 [Acidobacteriota bacterium]|nr:50S ribosomal protein L29 [Acidobacteriota bacterium]